MRQCCAAADIPTCPAVRAFGVDDDEPFLVGQLGVRRAIVISLCCTGAVVDRHDDGWARRKLGRHVDVHLGARRIGAEVGHLRDGLGGALEGRGGRHQLVKTGRRAVCGGGQQAGTEEG